MKSGYYLAPFSTSEEFLRGTGSGRKLKCFYPRALKTVKFINIPTSTVADSICVVVPLNGLHSLTQMKQFDGEMVSVTNAEIIRVQAEPSNSTRLFTEPAGAAAFAGFQKAAPTLDPDAVVVVVTTGNDLKDSASATLGIEVQEQLVKSIDDLL